jgi:hypothetical protein
MDPKEAAARLKRAKGALDFAIAGRDPAEIDAAQREHREAVYALQDSRFAAKIAAGNEQARQDQALADEAERARQAALTQRQHTPGTMRPKWCE